MEGWIKLHRQLLDNPISCKPSYLSVWIHLLLLANHEDKDFIYKNEKYTCARGQIVTSRAKLAERTGLAGSTVEDILRYLEKEGNIRQQDNSSFRLITVINYNQYQEVRQQAGQPADSQPDTNKNEKNEKNINTMRESSPKGDAVVESILTKTEGISYEYQEVGLRVWKELSAPPDKKSEFIRLAKLYPGLVQSAYTSVADHPQTSIRWKFFFWKFNQMLKATAKNATIGK